MNNNNKKSTTDITYKQLLARNNRCIELWSELEKRVESHFSHLFIYNICGISNQTICYCTRIHNCYIINDTEWHSCYEKFPRPGITFFFIREYLKIPSLKPKSKDFNIFRWKFKTYKYQDITKEIEKYQQFIHNAK